MTQPSPPLQPLSMVQPTTFQTAISEGHAPDGTRFCMLRIETSTGSYVLAMPATVAKTLGESLIEAADAKPKQGLIVPTPLHP